MPRRAWAHDRRSILYRELPHSEKDRRKDGEGCVQFGDGRVGERGKTGIGRGLNPSFLGERPGPLIA